MVLGSVDVFVESLREIHLLRAEQFDRLVHDFAPKFEETQDLAKHIVRLGWITLYQAKKILSGHAQELILGNYVIIEKIGEGGMGKVYKAKQLRLGRMVALKVIRPNLLVNELALKRFHREAKSAAQLAHPNIVRLFDADQVGDRHFLAMEFVEGTDLAKLVKDNGSLPIGMTCSFIRQAANGLQHAHDMGLVHRDIKPSNLLVTAPSKAGKTAAGGVIKILDMGLARAVVTPGDDESEISALTQDGTVIGTPDFMSPEQAKNSSTVDGRSDLYSLGCTFYGLLTGQAPFPGGSTLEKLLQHQMDAPTHVQLLRQDVPNEVASILHRLLAKRPEERFQSGAELATALEPWSVLDADNKRLNISNDSILPVIARAALRESDSPTAKDASGRTIVDPFDFDDLNDMLPLSMEMKPKAQVARRRKRPIALIAGIAGGILLLAFGIVLARQMTKKDPKNSPEPPVVKDDSHQAPKKGKTPTPLGTVKNELEPIDRYLPADSAIVAVLNVQQLDKSKFFQDEVQNRLDPYLAVFKATAGFDPLKSIDRVIIAVPETKSDQVVVVVQGYDFLTSDFLGWIGAMPGVEITQEKVAGQGMKSVYRLPPADKEKGLDYYGAILSGINPSTIVLSQSKDRVLDALARVDRRSEPTFDDASIRRMVGKYAPKSARPTAVSPPIIWMCVGCETKLLSFLADNKFKQIGSPRDGGILEMIASVRLGESLDFEMSIEAARRPQAVQGWEKIGNAIRFLSFTTKEPPVKRLADLIAGAKLSKDRGGKAETSAVVTWFNRIDPDKLSEWFAPFLGTLPMPAKTENP